MCDVLLLCHDVDRGVNLQGKAYSPLLDSVREDLEKRGLTCATLSHPWSKLYASKAWGSPISMNRSYFLCLLKDKVIRIFGAKKSREKHLSSVCELYVSILKKTRPSCIISIGAPAELCRAAKSINVFHVELLHGIGYAFVPWGYDKRKSEELPNGVFSLDDVSTRAFSTLGAAGVEVIKIPHPFLKRFLQKDLRNNLPIEWKLRNLKRSGSYKKEILIALQWSYAGEDGERPETKDILSNGLFPDALIDVIKETAGDIFWRFRLHPLHIRLDKYKPHIQFIEEFCVKYTNTEWRLSTSMPLPSVLSICSGTISMSSMSAYDAAYLGVPSLMLCPTLQRGSIYESYFGDLETAGYVTKAPITVSAIREWIGTVKHQQPMEVGIGDDAAWENAVNWMLGNPCLNTLMDTHHD